MSSDINQDLNTVIASAVNARIEAQVVEALAGDAMIGRMVTAALQQPITVRDSATYRDRKTTFLAHTIEQTLQEATKAAVQRVIKDEAPTLEMAVRGELRRNINTVAKQLVGSVLNATEKGYGITVEMKFPGRS